jgi:PKHD-type hydroxylase
MVPIRQAVAIACCLSRGARVASFLWVQSMVRDDAQRALLFDLDMAIALVAGGAGQRRAGGAHRRYHNLLRMWAEA